VILYSERQNFEGEGGLASSKVRNNDRDSDELGPPYSQIDGSYTGAEVGSLVQGSGPRTSAAGEAAGGLRGTSSERLQEAAAGRAAANNAG
jgi:hypothetical protein